MWLNNRILSCLLLVTFQRLDPTSAAPASISNDPNVPFIEKAVLAIPEEEFEKDPVVLRAELKGAVSFNNVPKRKNGTTVFKQKVPSKDKEVIVISGYDDYIRRSDGPKTQQRTYVVLRKMKDSDEHFHVNYVYVRDLFPGEDSKGSIKVGKKQRRIEFDVWDFRGSDSNIETRLGWSVCSRSSFISCRANPNLPFSFPVGQEPDYPDEEPPSKAPDESSGLTSIVEPSSVFLSHDYFTDLVDEFEHSWFVATTVNFVINTKLGLKSKVKFQEASDLKDAKEVTAESDARKKRQVEQDAAETEKKKREVAQATATAEKKKREVALAVQAVKERQVQVAKEASAEKQKRHVAEPTAEKAKRQVAQAVPSEKLKRAAAAPTPAPAPAAADEEYEDDDEVTVTEGSGKYSINIQMKTQMQGGGGGGGGSSSSSSSSSSNNVRRPGAGKPRQKRPGNRNPLGKTAPDREYLNMCLGYLEKYNVGGRSDDAIESGYHQANVAKSTAIYGTDNSELIEGSDKRGMNAHGDNSDGGVLSPLDGAMSFVGNVLGYSGASVHDTNNKNGLSGAFVSTGYNTANMWFNWVDKNTDMVSKGLGVGKISNDRSNLDGFFDEFLPGIFGGIPAVAADIIGMVTTPLGLNGVAKPIASLLASVWAGIVTAVPAPIKAVVNVVKAGAKKLGVGGLIGMRGSSDKAGITFCLNNFDRVSRALVEEAERVRKLHNGGRSFGSKPVRMEGLNAGVDLADVDNFRPMGWRGLISNHKEPFIGFGHCNSTLKVTIAELTKASKSSDDLVEFYMQTLRTYCDLKQKAQILKLIKEKHLKMNKDGTFSIHSDSHLATKEKLSVTELGYFSQAFEWATYTKVYAQELRHPTNVVANPDGLAIAHAAGTLNKFALTAVEDAITHYPLHSVKLIRNVLITLKTGLVKSLQSWHMLQVCNGIKNHCIEAEQWLVGDNILSVIGTMDFIVNRFEPGVSEKAPKNLDKAYHDYYMAYRINITERMANYVLPAMGVIGLPKAIRPSSEPESE